jgi:hypothetical protein
MNNIKKRFVLFLGGCILLRFLLVVIAKNTQRKNLPILGYLALIPALGFTYIYLTDSRKTGPEVMGGKIWWNDLRPVHALLFFLFAYEAIHYKTESYKYLLIDVILGLLAFLNYHFLK